MMEVEQISNVMAGIIVVGTLAVVILAGLLHHVGYQARLDNAILKDRILGIVQQATSPYCPESVGAFDKLSMRLNVLQDQVQAVIDGVGFELKWVERQSGWEAQKRVKGNG